MRNLLLEKYQELLALAEEFPQYTYLVVNMFLETSVPTILNQIGVIRDQLTSCASVQVRGYSNFYSGTGESHHDAFGSTGPQQISICHRGKLTF